MALNIKDFAMAAIHQIVGKGQYTCNRSDRYTGKINFLVDLIGRCLTAWPVLVTLKRAPGVFMITLSALWHSFPALTCDI